MSDSVTVAKYSRPELVTYKNVALSTDTMHILVCLVNHHSHTALKNASQIQWYILLSELIPATGANNP